MTFKKTFIASLVAVSAAATISTAHAFNVQSKPVTVVIPFAPGGGVDQTFRNLQKYAATKGITLNPVYKPGAEGVIAKRELIGMPEDGFHLSITTAGVIANYRMTNPETDVVPITAIRDSIMVFVTHPNININSFDELEKSVKDGKKVSFGFGAPGQRMVLDQFFSFAKPSNSPLLVPYKGGVPVVNDLLGGHVDVAAVPLSIVKNHIDSGKLKLLAIGARTKIEGLPDVTLVKAKYPTWEDPDAFAIVVEKGTDPAAIKFWSDFMKEYMNDSAIRKEFASEWTIPAEFGPKAIEKMIELSTKNIKATKQ
jgi:tripartite-type tricarboxylate transporter receptor subunit TctC